MSLGTVTTRNLALSVIYLSPLNRPCRWVPKGSVNAWGNHLHFEYLDEPRGAFPLTHANLKHMRVLDDRGSHAAAG